MTTWHIHCFYKLLITNPGAARENLKKPDGTTWDLRCLMEAHKNNQKNKPTKDSFNWSIEPPNSFNHLIGQQQKVNIQAYFCETCLIIQGVPAKHCKLCESCCPKFDHHCLFVNKCVGLKNHRVFILFLFSTIVNVLYFLFKIFFYFDDFNNELDQINLLKPISEQLNIFYYAFASANHIWFIQLFAINSFTTIMVTFLLIYQLKFITLGFTSQFPPPFMFTKVNQKTKGFISSIFHRFENLYIFLFKSCECNEELYHRQQNDYNSNLQGNKTIALGLYPRNESHANDFLIENPKRQNSHNHNHSHGRCNHSHDSNQKFDETV